MMTTKILIACISILVLLNGQKAKADCLPSVFIGRDTTKVMSQNLNLITTRTVLKAGVKTDAAISSLPVDSVKEATTYYDGLGRPIQSVITKGSPGKIDIVQHIAYDGFGRETRKFLPYVGGNDGLYKKTAAVDQINFYKNTSGANPITDLFPFADTRFEDSPLNRPVEQGAPGKDWQLGANTVSMDYQINAENEVFYFTVGDDNSCIWNAQYYAPSQLLVNVVSDENKHISKEYKDNQGQIVLKSVYDGAKYLRTYYVYDDLQKLRYVIPPRAVEYLEDKKPASFMANDPILKDLIFYYRYDPRLRLVEKRLPGAEPVLMVYDQRDRLVLSQDGNMRGNSQWLFTKYDELNRPVVTGLTKFEKSTQEDLQTAYATSTPANETRSACTIGYSNVEGTMVLKYLTATYYDDYLFEDAHTFSPVAMLNGKTPTQIVRGRVTGTRVLIMDDQTTPTYTLSTTFYDDRYRPIQIQRKNILPDSQTSGADETISTQFDFEGKVKQTMQVQKVNKVSIPIFKYMTYDHAGRLLRTEMSINYGSRTSLSILTYNKLGQLQNKKLGGTTTSNYIDETNYNYTIRGWLKSINSLALTGKQHFGMLLSYNDAMGDLTNTAQWNGNISGVKWATSTLAETFGYAYSYDAINRLTKADFGRSGKQWSTLDKSYDEENITYDANGNFSTYQRYDENGTLKDNMVYGYNNGNYSNKLRYVTGSGSLSPTPNATVGDLYQYDANGNLIKDNIKNNHIAGIKYNYLNLPSYIPFSDQNSSITYIYDAIGIKLCKKTNSNEIPKITTQYYAGNMVYDVGKKLLFVLTDEGRAIAGTSISGNLFTYEYNIKDHLGNVRMVLRDNGSANGLAVQENHYYPFGMRMSGLGMVDGSATANKYLYNGKEMQSDFDLNWLDFRFRYYDNITCRFWTQDRLAEKFSYMSPYQFCSNSPIWMKELDGLEGIKYTDENGKKIIEKNVVVLTEKHKEIPKNATQKQIDKITKQNISIDKRNADKIEGIKNELNNFYNGSDGAKLSSGESVTFKFNVKGIPDVDKKGLSSDQLDSKYKQISKENGIPAVISSYGQSVDVIAPAAVITNDGASGGVLGNCRNNIIRMNEGPVGETSHEVGHGLGLDDNDYQSGGILNSPPEQIIPTEVDFINSVSYEKK